MNDFPRSLNYNIESSILNRSGNIEIEAKFRNAKLTLENFNRLIKTIEDDKTYHESHSFTTDYYQKNKRFTETLEGVYITTKTSLIKPIIFDFRDIEIKVTISSEEKKESSIPKRFIFKREKKRTTFSKDNIQLDLTEITQDDIVSYEVEIEVINYEDFNYKKFTTKITEIYDILKNPYTSIIKFFNVSMGGNKDNKILNYYLISQARDLNFRDITNDGLLNHYTISVKADGIQKFLVFHKTGIWLLWPILNDIEKSHIWISPLTEEFEYLENTMFTGELLSEEDHNRISKINTKYVYLPFDTTVYKGENITHKNYLERRKYLEEINEKQIGKVLKIYEKKIFIYQNNPEDFHSKVREAFDYQEEVDYKTDGLMFTPINSPYITLGQSKPKNMRVLGKFPDVCKYKLPKDLTIDFKVKNGKLFSLGGNFNLAEYRMDDPDKYENKIVEFEPEFDNRKITLVPRKIRLDKSEPNRIEVAKENWNNLQDPILPETLKGENAKMLMKYHGQIKREIINIQEGYVIDIGSGKGGDLDKYWYNSKIKKVLCIEPNQEFAEEFTRRMLTKRYNNKFKLIISGGEDCDKIISNAEDFFPSDFINHNLNINFMISLSFFWKSDVLLNSLIRTISYIRELYHSRKGNRKILINFFTIEGSRVQNIFKELGNNITLNTIHMSREGEKKIAIDISDSNTVHEQTEYLVFLDQLWEKSGFKPIRENTPLGNQPHDFILSKNERIYSSLFVYGSSIFLEKIDNKIVYPTEKLEVNPKKGVPHKGQVSASGDDKLEIMEHIHPQVNRIATLDNKKSLYHSILKILNKGYKDKGAEEREELAQELHDKLKGKNDLSELSKILKYGFIVHEGSNRKKHGDDSIEKWILLNKNKDKTFEPLVYLDDKKMHGTFGNSSFLVN